MKIFVPFIDGSLQYDCKKCGGACCKYGLLPLTNSEKKKIVKTKPQLNYFANAEDDNITGFARYESCWFLKNGARCSLETTHGYGNKPLFCRLYPFKAIKCNDLFFIHVVTLCPTLTISHTNKDLISDSIVKNAEEVIKLGVYRQSPISDECLKNEIQIFNDSLQYLDNNCYLNFLSTQDQISTTKATAHKKRLSDYLTYWLNFLMFDKCSLQNKKISYELTVLTTIIRLLMLTHGHTPKSEILAALYLYALIYNKMKMPNRKPTTIFTYISLLNLADGLHTLLNRSLSKHQMIKYLTNKGISNINPKSDLDTLIKKYMPKSEQRVMFLRTIGRSFINIDDRSLI